MKVSEARAAVGGLSKTSKMPCKSWGISAKECKTGSKLAKVEGTVCHGCYALKAHMFGRSGKGPRQTARLDAIFTTGWVDAMVTAINGDEFFRWFDSGDIQSDEHLANIVRVAIATPSTKHWLPTKEYLMIARFMRKHGSFPKNLVVRVSSPNIDQAPIKHYQHTSTVHTGKPFGRECIAYKQTTSAKIVAHAGIHASKILAINTTKETPPWPYAGKTTYMRKQFLLSQTTSKKWESRISSLA